MKAIETGRNPTELLPQEENMFRLTHVGNSRIIESLSRFRQLGMTGPYAAGIFLALFEAVPFAEEHPGLVQTGQTPSETLWDQVGWAFSHPKELTGEQWNSLLTLQYFALDTLANQPQFHAVAGETPDVSLRVRETAQTTLDAYTVQLAKIFDPDNPRNTRTIQTLKTAARTVGSATLGAALIMTLARCGPGPQGYEPSPGDPVVTQPAAGTTEISAPDVPGMPTLQATGTAVIITETPTSPFELGSVLPDVQALSGVAVTPDQLIQIGPAGVQASLNFMKFGLVHVGSTVSVEVAGNPNTCYTALALQIFNPAEPNTPETLISQQDGVALYGNTKVVVEVPTPSSLFVCAQGYALEGNSTFAPGTIVNFLLRPAGRAGSVEVAGTMRAAFPSGSDVRVVNNVVTVDNVAQRWEFLNLGTQVEAPASLDDFPLILPSDEAARVGYAVSTPALTGFEGGHITLNKYSALGQTGVYITGTWGVELALRDYWRIRNTDGYDFYKVAIELLNADGTSTILVGYIGSYWNNDPTYIIPRRMLTDLQLARQGDHVTLSIATRVKEDWQDRVYPYAWGLMNDSPRQDIFSALGQTRDSVPGNLHEITVICGITTRFPT
jgi:hypothetical protein